MNNNSITIENVWGEKSENLILEIIQTWQSLRILPPQIDPQERARQVVFIARNQDKQIIGITTAFLQKVELLRSHLFIYRCMIHPQFRIPGLLLKLTAETLQYLESIHRSLKPRPIGVFAEIENPQLKEIREVVTPTGFTFIGFSPRGNPLRVYYFKGAWFGPE